MNTERTDPAKHVSREQVLAFVRAMIGEGSGRQDDQHLLPPGPWDPVLRVALEQFSSFGPSPVGRFGGSEGLYSQTAPPVVNPAADHQNVAFPGIRNLAIFDAMGDGRSFGDAIALNRQPLPPRAAFLIAAAQAVIRRAEFLQEIAGAIARDDLQQSIVIVGAYTARFSDDWCATEFRLRWPLPSPRPHWFFEELDGIDLITVATQFEQGADRAFNPELRQHLITTSTKLTEAGLSKLGALIAETSRAVP